MSSRRYCWVASMSEKRMKPAIRFAGFTEEWEQRKLGNISSSYSGGTPAVGVKEFYDGAIPFIRSAEINSESTDLYITQQGFENSSARMANIGDILYALYGATSGEVGHTSLFLSVAGGGRLYEHFFQEGFFKGFQLFKGLLLEGDKVVKLFEISTYGGLLINGARY